MYFICIVCILLSAANGVINDDDNQIPTVTYQMDFRYHIITLKLSNS